MARTLNSRITEAGRIRIGDRDGNRPRKLEHFRLTSTNPATLNLAATLYGGEVTEWKQQGSTQRQWQLYTKVNSLDVVVLLQQGCSLTYEQYQGGYCTRRCDGNFIIKSPYEPGLEGTECQCEDSPDAPCKLTMRFSVLLPDLTGMGQWRLETHGFYTASALKGTLDLLKEAMPGHALIEAVMTLTTETRKTIAPDRDGKPKPQTFHFPVVTIQPKFTPRQLAAGIPNQALLLAQEQRKSLAEHNSDLFGDRQEIITCDPETGQPDGFDEDPAGYEIMDVVPMATPAATPAQESPQTEATAEDQAEPQEWIATWKAGVAVLRERELAGDFRVIPLMAKLERALAAPEKLTQAQQTILGHQLHEALATQ